MTSSVPLNIAHRGASALEPENTLRAFEAAWRAGADGIELDVFLTSDKVCVVTHDADTKRLAGHSYNVRKTPFSILRTLDFGKGEKIPTLDEVLAAYSDKFLAINIEIKSTGFRSDGVEKHVVKSVKKHGCARKILVSSFNPLNVQRVKKLLPEVRVGYLIDAVFKNPAFHLRTIEWLKPDTLNLHPALYGHAATRAFFETGRPLWIWNVDTAKEWLFWRDQGAEALITDHPARVRRLFHPEAALAKMR